MHHPPNAVVKSVFYGKVYVHKNVHPNTTLVFGAVEKRFISKEGPGTFFSDGRQIKFVVDFAQHVRKKGGALVFVNVNDVILSKRYAI